MLPTPDSVHAAFDRTFTVIYDMNDDGARMVFWVHPESGRFKAVGVVPMPGVPMMFVEQDLYILA